jgi:hypothetical protein
LVYVSRFAGKEDHRMTTEIPGGRVRASDAEREEYATKIRDAVGEGRLTLGEGDERLAAIYATKFRDELHTTIADLPVPAPPEAGGRSPAYRGGGFRRHLTFVVLVSAVLVGLWALSGAQFFWPAIPMFFLFIGLYRHARWAGWRHSSYPHRHHRPSSRATPR